MTTTSVAIAAMITLFPTCRQNVPDVAMLGVVRRDPGMRQRDRVRRDLPGGAEPAEHDVEQRDDRDRAEHDADDVDPEALDGLPASSCARGRGCARPSRCRRSCHPRQRAVGVAAQHEALVHERAHERDREQDHGDRAAVAELVADEAVATCRSPSCSTRPAGPPRVMIQMRSKSCSEPMIARNPQIRIVGPSNGIVM